jgi:hypothetical protein
MKLASIFTADSDHCATGRYGRIFGGVVIVIADRGRLSRGRRDLLQPRVENYRPPIA